MSADASVLQYDVFISYARADANMGAAPLDSALKRDFRVWRDVRNLDPAQDFTAELEQAIKASKCIVVCITPDVERTDSFVRREIGFASYLKKPILVARFADVPPPIHIFTHTWIDFFAGWDNALDKLWRWLRGESIDSAATTSIPASSIDPYRAYVERLYADVVESLRVSVFSTETITLRAVESIGDVPRKTRRLNPKFVPYVLKDKPEPELTTTIEFESLHEAYISTSCDGRVLLLGEPGAGKTTSLLAFARDAAAARLSDASQPLPAFARISGWDSDRQTPLAEWLAVREDGITADAFQGLIEHGRALLLLDGLDELGSSRSVDRSKPNGEKYDPRERFLKVLPTTCKVILSSRIEEYRQIREQARLSCAMRLQQLDDVQMQAYLADVIGLWDVVKADKSLKEALRTPLLLALFRVSFEEAPEEARNLQDLSAGDFNDKIWGVFIDKRWAFEQARTSIPLTYSANELKARLGKAVVGVMGDEMRVDDTRILTQDVDGDDAMRLIALAMRLDVLVAAGNTPVFVQTETDGETYRFLHLRLRDALAFPVALGIGLLNNMATWALGRLGDKRAVSLLLAALHTSDEDVRSAAAYSLGNLGDMRAVRPLIAALQDQGRFVRENAAYSLGNLGDVRAVKPLIAALHTSDKGVRYGAVDSLGKLGDVRAIKPLVVVLLDRDEMSQMVASDALERFDNMLVVKALIANLRHPDEAIRSKTAEKLGQLGDERAIKPLISSLHDSDSLVRLNAVYALGQLGDRRVIEALIFALSDPDGYVSSCASKMLKRFEEQPIVRSALRDYRAGWIEPRDE